MITSCARNGRVRRGFRGRNWRSSWVLLLLTSAGALLVAGGPGAQAAGPGSASAASAGSASAAGSRLAGSSGSAPSARLAESSASAAGSRLAADSEGTVDRKITDKRITESSGLAASVLHPGVLWTNNDSGNPPRIYAIGAKGSTKATLTLRAEPNVDWEAIATLRAKDGRALIAVGDIGDNNAQHSSVRIALVAEPDALDSASVTPERVLRLRYPGGPRDAEALLADPRTGRLYIVSKTLFGSELYAVPKRLWPDAASGARVSTVTTLTKVASMTAGLITDGVFLPDGRMLLRGYGRAFVIAKPETVRNGRLPTLADDTLPEQDQGESIALADGGRHALIGSEGKREPVLRIAVPGSTGEDSADTGTGSNAATAPSVPGAEAAGPVGATVPADPRFSGVGNLRVWVLVTGGGIAVVVLTAAGLMLGTRRR